MRARLVTDSLIPDSLIPDSLIPDSLIPSRSGPPAGVTQRVRSEKKEKNFVAEKSATGLAGTRLAEDWVLPKPWGDWALEAQPDWNAKRLRQVADSFADYWHSKPGAAARKTDWFATWRNWVRRESQDHKTRNGPVAQMQELEEHNRRVAEAFVRAGNVKGRVIENE